MNYQQDIKLEWPDVFASTLRHSFTNYRSVVKPAIFWWGIAFCAVIIGIFSGINTRSESTLIMWVLFGGIVAAVGTAVIAINWHRKLLQNDECTTWTGFGEGISVWGYFWRSALIGIVAGIALKILLALGYFPASIVSSTGDFWAFLKDPPLLIYFPALAIQGVISVRLGLILPAYATEDAGFDALTAWSQSKKYSLNIVVTFALLVLVIAIAFFVVWLVYLLLVVVGGSIFASILAALALFAINFFVLLVSLSVLTVYYAAIIGRTDLLKENSRD